MTKKKKQENKPTYRVDQNGKIIVTDEESALARIAQIKEYVEAAWDEASNLADKYRLIFDYCGPDQDRGGTYYPPKPDDWKEVKWDERGSIRDPNRDHPEYEEYHPWDEGYEGWVSSSARC